tara:strand:- start:4713 stop:4910 length:198 start_codon:yes stop_codon:yes gene_type:complete
MGIELVNKALLFLLYFAILNIIRNSFFLIRTFREEERFVLNKTQLISLGLSIAYVLMSLTSNIKL